MQVKIFQLNIKIFDISTNSHSEFNSGTVDIGSDRQATTYLYDLSLPAVINTKNQMFERNILHFEVFFNEY